MSQSIIPSLILDARKQKEENAEARELLEEMTEPVYEFDGYWCCTCCAALYPTSLRRGLFWHESDCPWRRIRVFLAQEKEASDGE
jgi:hypothetical protein